MKGQAKVKGKIKKVWRGKDMMEGTKTKDTEKEKKGKGRDGKGNGKEREWKGKQNERKGREEKEAMHTGREVAGKDEKEERGKEGKKEEN